MIPTITASLIIIPLNPCRFTLIKPKIKLFSTLQNFKMWAERVAATQTFDNGTERRTLFTLLRAMKARTFETQSKDA